MSKSNYRKIDRALEIIWLVIIFFIPIYFDRNLYNVFEIPKNILFQGLVEILLFVYLVALILKRKSVIEVIKKRIKYFIPAIVFVIVLGISTLLSQVQWFSFWGSWERRMGYLAWLHFFVFAFILFTSLKDKKQVYRILLAMVFSSIFVVLYGFIQAFGFDPFSWTEDPFKTKRIFSAVGQPNFLGSWLLLVIPVVVYGFFRKKAAIKVFSGILLVLLIYALILTKSRGAWIGLIALVGFMGMIYLWRLKKTLIVIPIICLIAFVGFIVFLNRAGVDEAKFSYGPFLGRIATFADLQEAGNYRLMHWKASLDLIKKRPVLGYGLGSQRFNFPKYYQPEFAIYEKPNIYLDYAHNDILDVLLAAGFIGLFSYLFLIGSAFFIGLRHFFRKEKNGILVFLLLSGLFAYLVSILFSFHVMSTLVYFWVFIVLVMVFALPTFRERLESGGAREILAGEQKGGGLTTQKSLYILLLLALLITSLWHFNSRLYISGSSLLDARRVKAYGDWQKAFVNHEKAIRFNPRDPYFRQEYALSLYQASFLIPSEGMTRGGEELSSEQKQKLNILNTGIAQIQSISVGIRPIEALIWLPWLKTEKANVTQRQTDFDDAEQAYEAVAGFSPQTALIYKQWCSLKTYEHDFERARDMCEKALLLYPDIKHPHMNLEHRQNVVDEMAPVYLNLARVYQQTGNIDMAIDRAEKSVYFIREVYVSPYPPILDQAYSLLSTLYSGTGDKEKAEFYKEKAQGMQKSKVKN